MYIQIYTVNCTLSLKTYEAKNKYDKCIINIFITRLYNERFQYAYQNILLNKLLEFKWKFIIQRASVIFTFTLRLLN